MSVGNLYDLSSGSKPYQDLYVDSLTCNELFVDGQRISTSQGIKLNGTLNSTVSEIPIEHDNLIFIPEVSGLYLFTFSTQLSTTIATDNAYVIFRYPFNIPPFSLIEENTFAKPINVLNGDFTAITNNGVTFLEAGQTYEFTVLFRAGVGATARIQRTVIVVNYLLSSLD